MEVANNLPDIVRDVTARIEAARDVFLAVVQNLRGTTESDIPQLRPDPPSTDSDGDEEGDGDILMSTVSGALVYLTETPAMVAQVIFALVLLFFLLSSSDLIYLKIIQSFDGDITVDSTPGRGTTFTVTLPPINHDDRDAPGSRVH